ncbi:MAG: NAD-dependent epimerase/dehydratase family protein [Nitrososphaerota archaeon]
MLVLKKTLVTGGAGLIGSHLVDRLISNDRSIRVLDNFSSRIENIVHYLSNRCVKLWNIMPIKQLKTLKLFFPITR